MVVSRVAVDDWKGSQWQLGLVFIPMALVVEFACELRRSGTNYGASVLTVKRTPLARGIVSTFDPIGMNERRNTTACHH